MSDLKGVYEIVGYRPISYKRSDGTQVTGTEVSLRLCESLEGQVGVPDESVWLPSRATCKPDLGLLVRKSYNRWGKVEDLIPV